MHVEGAHRRRFLRGRREGAHRRPRGRRRRRGARRPRRRQPGRRRGGGDRPVEGPGGARRRFAHAAAATRHDATGHSRLVRGLPQRDAHCAAVRSHVVRRHQRARHRPWWFVAAARLPTARPGGERRLRRGAGGRWGGNRCGVRAQHRHQRQGLAGRSTSAKRMRALLAAAAASNDAIDIGECV